MTQVQIVKDWKWPDLLRQTPNHSGSWQGIQFTLDPVPESDYVIVLNGVNTATTVICPPQHIWSIPQEPPTEFCKPFHENPAYSFRMFTTDEEATGPNYIHSQPALPWHVNHDYDFLSACRVPEKSRPLSWITSRLQYLQGHRARMRFLTEIQGQLDLDLIATYEYYLRQPGTTRKTIAAEQAQLGFVCVEDKWDGLAPYRYSIAIENYSNSFYWSEKLVDCYLAWCMPIYYGCTRITDYFPAESLIQIDIKEPEAAIATIQEAIATNAWQRNQDAIAYARELILNRYQLFPFLVNQIDHFESTHGIMASEKERVMIEPITVKMPLKRGIRQKGKKVLMQAARIVGLQQ